MAYVSILSAALGSVAALAFYIVCVIVYRLAFHPLAKYPGPFLAKITSLYNLYHVFMKDRHRDQYRCHEKYGPYVRYGPNSLLINTKEGLHDIYAGPRTSNVRKGPMYHFLHELDGSSSTHGLIDKDKHAIKRRIMAHGFSESALRGLEPYMIENIDKWIKALGADANAETKGWTPPRNMAVWANYVTFDVLGDLCFGKSFRMIDREDLRNIPAMVLNRTRMFPLIGYSPIGELWRRWLAPYKIDHLIVPRQAKQLANFTQFAASALKERLALADVEKISPDENQRKDFVYWLLRGQDPVTGHTHSRMDFVSESRLLITAGSDTSSITLAAACFYLTRHPEKLQRLQQELRSNFEDVNQIVNGTQMGKCHYLRAVIDETLRMSPPVASSLEREVMKGGMTIDGQFFSEGTLVGTSSYAIHYNKGYHTNPYSFRPERWMADEAGTTSDEVAITKAAFCPFSLGTRGCIGKQMAYNELSIILGRLFYLYDIRLMPGDHTGEDEKGAYNIEDVFVAERNGPMVQFRKRE